MIVKLKIFITYYRQASQIIELYFIITYAIRTYAFCTFVILMSFKNNMLFIILYIIVMRSCTYKIMIPYNKIKK